MTKKTTLSKKRNVEHFEDFRDRAIKNTYSKIESVTKTEYGLRKKQSLKELVLLSRKGMSYKKFSKIDSKLNLSIDDWCKILEISKRTMDRYKEKNRTFDSLPTEKIYEIDLIYKKGVDIFRSEEKFLNWLERKNMIIGNVKPKELLDTSFGIELVKQELTKLEYCLFV